MYIYYTYNTFSIACFLNVKRVRFLGGLEKYDQQFAMEKDLCIVSYLGRTWWFSIALLVYWRVHMVFIEFPYYLGECLHFLSTDFHSGTAPIRTDGKN